MLVHRILLDVKPPQGGDNSFYYGEFDSGSERTLAAWIRHASRTEEFSINPSGESDFSRVAKGLVTRGQSALKFGIARRKAD